MQNLSCISADFGGDVLLDDRGESSLVLDVGDPAWELGVPNGGVSTNKLVIGLSPVDEEIEVTEVEGALGGFNCLPFSSGLD